MPVVKNTANENSSIRKTKKLLVILLSNCAISGKKKSTFIKNKEVQKIDQF